jgi:excisionase family DNA binding protein
MSTQFSSTQPLLTIRQVAEQLCVDHQTIRAWIKNGKLRSLRVGSHLRIQAEDLSAIVTTNTRKYSRGAVSA